MTLHRITLHSIKCYIILHRITRLHRKLLLPQVVVRLDDKLREVPARQPAERRRRAQLLLARAPEAQPREDGAHGRAAQRRRLRAPRRSEAKASAR